MIEQPTDKPILIDAHCHLTDPRLVPIISDVIANAQQQGITHMISCAASIDDWDNLRMLAEKHPCIIPAFGIHPWFSQHLPTNWLQQLERILSDLPHALVGEIGLDRCRPSDDTQAEEDIFIQQLHLATEQQRPTIIHCVRAWDPVIPILQQHASYKEGFLLHAYGGPAELIQPLTQMGAYFSFGGTLTNPKAKRVKAALCAVPNDRLLLETDAPDFLPHTITDRTQPNEPANLPIILTEAASLLNQERTQVASHTRTNAIRFIRSETFPCG